MTTANNGIFEADFIPALPKGYRLNAQKQIEYVSIKTDKEGNKTEEWHWLCSQLEIVARTQDSESKNNGLLIRIKAPSKVWHEIALPAELWVNDGRVLREILANNGLKPSQSQKAKQALLNLFSLASPQETALCVDRIGWHKQSFVLPDTAYSPTGEKVGRVVFQSSHALPHAFKQSGSLQDWKDNIAHYAVGNSRLIFGIATAFAAPLLELTHSESGVFHFYGGTSCGKTTLLEVAGSVWGGGGIEGYKVSWRATDNGLEGVASNHCDALLCLDELGQVSPYALSQAIYMIGNNQGKTRSNKLGQAQKPAEWRILGLSSGEITIAQKVGQAKGKASKLMAGQQVRFNDIPVDTGSGMKGFEDCHNMKPDQFAMTLKDNVSEYYGTAARAFLERLVSEDRNSLREEIKAIQAEFVQDHCKGMTEPLKRVAGRFGLVIAAGQLATRWNITGWQDGATLEAVKIVFMDWLAERGNTTMPTEIMDGLKQIQGFIEAHGTSRFTLWDLAQTDTTQNRCGFVRQLDDRQVFYIFTNAWKDKVCSGCDSQALAKYLADKGILSRGESKNLAKRVRLPDSTNKRVYVLDAQALEDYFIDIAKNRSEQSEQSEQPQQQGGAAFRPSKTHVGTCRNKGAELLNVPTCSDTKNQGRNSSQAPTVGSVPSRSDCSDHKMGNPVKNAGENPQTDKPLYNHGSV